MAFAECNGIALPCFADAWEEAFDHIGDIESRSIDGTMLETRAGVKRKWRFTSYPLRADRYRKWRRLLEAWGQGWSFEDPVFFEFSLAGFFGGPSVMTRTTTTPATGVAAGDLASGGFFGIDGRHRMNVSRRGIEVQTADAGWDPTVDGWTMSFFHDSGGLGNQFFTCFGKVEFARGASDNPAGITQYRDGIEGSFDLGRIINIERTGPAFFSVAAHDLVTGFAAPAEYDELWLCPFEFLNEDDPAGNGTWAAQLDTHARVNGNPIGMPPIWKLSGDAIDDGPVDVIGRIRRAKQMGAVNAPQGATVFEAENFMFECEIFEV